VVDLSDFYNSLFFWRTTVSAIWDSFSEVVMVAQQRPDFSGEWSLNLQMSRLSPAVAAAVQSWVACIDHAEPIFRCKSTLVIDGKPIEYAFERR
jgi:hypothetical protein